MSKTIITIIQEIDSNKVIVECALCRGSGQRPGYTSDTPCKACGGIGGQPLTGEFEILG